MTCTTSQKTIALHNIRIDSPCTASWASMAGDERVRHCGDCNKSVFNLSAMPEADAAALLANNTDGELCVRFYQRADGTVMTSDCGTSTRARTRRALRKLPAVAGAALFALSATGSATAEPIPVVRISHPLPVRDAGTMMMGAPIAILAPLAEPASGRNPAATITPGTDKPASDQDKKPAANLVPPER